MTLQVVVETTDQSCLYQLFFGDCPHHARFRGHPLVAVAAIGCQSGKVFTNAKFLQSPLSLRGYLPLFPDDNPNQKISKIYFVDNKMKKASPEERLRYRQEKVA